MSSFLQFFASGGNSALSLSRNTPLSAIVPSCVFDLDATIEASYGGSGQTWKNLATPADGSAQTAYDFLLGATSSPSTDDPTFNGTAGSPAAYFSTDGGDSFMIPANTTFLNDLHRTDKTQPFTFGMAYRVVSGGFAIGISTGRGLAFAGGGQGIATVSDVGSNAHYFGSHGDSSATFNTISGVTGNTIYLVIFSYNPATNTLRRYINSSTKSSVTYSRPTSTTNPASPARILAYSNAPLMSSANTRLYSAFACNAFLDDDEVALIKAHLELRHERTY